MTPGEYRSTIAGLGLSQAGAARLLGVDERTSRRWALGEREIPAPAARLLQLLALCPIGQSEAMKLLERG